MLRNCSQCHRVFSHPTQRLCPSCFQAHQKLFESVKEYLRDHPRAKVAEVAEATGATLEQIYEYIRQGRLSVIPVDIELTCEICDSPITQGRICAKCGQDLEDSPHRSKPIPASPTGSRARMHILDKIREGD